MPRSQQVQQAQAERQAQDATTTPPTMPPTMPPTTAPPATPPRALNRSQEMLLEFLRDHDAACPPTCPACGYDVRALTTPICPECKHELTLTVGLWGGRLRLDWLFIALAPGFFSGIAACFVLIPIVGMFFEDGTLALPLIGLDLFGWSSGLFAILLIMKRNRFIAQPRARQRWFALLIWLIHVAAFVTFIFLMDAYV